jgi:hypothetical protein
MRVQNVPSDWIEPRIPASPLELAQELEYLHSSEAREFAPSLAIVIINQAGKLVPAWEPESEWWGAPFSRQKNENVVDLAAHI